MLPDDGGGEGVGDREQEGHHGARPASRSLKMLEKFILVYLYFLRKFFPKLLQKIDNLVFRLCWQSLFSTSFVWLVVVIVMIFDSKLFSSVKKFFPNSEKAYRNHYF